MLLKLETQASIWPLNLIAVKLPVFSSTMGQNSSTNFFYDSNQLTRQHILDQDRLQCSWRTWKQCIACGGNILSDYLGCCSDIKLSYQVKEGHIKTARVLLTESRWPEGIHVQKSLHISPQFLVNDNIAVVCLPRLQTTRAEVLCMSSPGELSFSTFRGTWKVNRFDFDSGSLRRMRWKCSSYSSNVCLSIT